MVQMTSSISEKMTAWQVSGGALDAGLPATAQGADCGLQTAMLTRSVQTCYSINGEEAGLASAAGTNCGTGWPFNGSPVIDVEMASAANTAVGVRCAFIESGIENVMSN